VAKTPKTAQPATGTRAWESKWLGVALWEWAGLVLIVAVGAWLRFSNLGLIEFKGDEATAAELALRFVRDGVLPKAGLMSSVGVTNPPMFIYLLIPMFAISSDPQVITCLLVLQGLAAVVLCWYIGRKYIGPVAGLTAAALFSFSPWAVFYSRKIWAIDVEPLWMVLLLWSVLSLVIDKKAKAIFWVALLCLCLCQNHYAGCALTGAIVGMLVILRPRCDWRWAAAGVAISVVAGIPYLQFQQENNWKDFQQILHTVGGQKFQIPPGITIHPMSGHRLPRQEHWVHALAIMNAGEPEDVLGLSTSSTVDPYKIWQKKIGGSQPYFDENLTWGDWLLVLERLLYVVGVIYLSVRAVRAIRRTKAFPYFEVEEDAEARIGLILVAWVAGTLAVFYVTKLWTLLLYYVILYPTHFWVLGILFRDALRKAKAVGVRSLIVGGLILILAGNLVYLQDMYRFLTVHGGAFGTYGSGLGYKTQAARFLLENTDVKQLQADQRLGQMDQFGRLEPPQEDLPYLLRLESHRVARSNDAIPTNTVVVLVDDNRSYFTPEQWGQLTSMPQTNFGPIRLFFAKR
jgi:hypothetical protein